MENKRKETDGSGLESKKFKGSSKSGNNGIPEHNKNGQELKETQAYESSDEFENIETEQGTLEYSPDLEEESFIGNTKNINSISESDIVDKEMPIDSTKLEQEQDIKVSLSKIESVQRDAVLISSVIPYCDVDKVYDKLLLERKEKNRIDIVTNTILEKDGVSEADANRSLTSSSSESIFNDVAEVLVTCPSANPSTVYDMIEKHAANPERIKLVLHQLSENLDHSSKSDSSVREEKCVSVTSSKNSTDLFDVPAFRSNPLYKDLKTLRKVLPEKDPNEIYAYLEAHFDKPNRVQIVIDELTKSESQESIPVGKESFDDLDKGKAPLTAEDTLQADFKQLKEIFGDCDPNFLYEKLNSKPDDPDRVTNIAMYLFEHKQYPKLKDVLENERKKETKSRITNKDFSMEDFLKRFPDPVVYFDDINRQVNQNYKAHVTVYLKNKYTYLKDGFIKKTLEKHKHHLSPAIREIENELEEIMERPSKKKRATPRESQLEYPDDPEELFFQEVLFCNNRKEVQDHLDNQKKIHTAKVKAARDQGELLECDCCFDDECLFEDMQSCTDGHLFCKMCILRSSEAAIGEGKTQFYCLTGTCEHQFPLSVLQEVLPPGMFSLALRKMQEEEIRQADIPDLVTCPFCSFATIMPDQEDKVFKCLNKECLRESCRLCREPNHIPLRCSEVEKQGETNMRTFIETKMSEAMLRTCANCKKRFYKDTGCNKMTCSCGASMCYICREPNIDYTHFDNGKCSIDCDIFELHKTEMLEAAEKARQEYLSEHPDQDQDLKYDPVKLIEKMKNRWENASGDIYESGDEDYDD